MKIITIVLLFLLLPIVAFVLGFLLEGHRTSPRQQVNYDSITNVVLGKGSAIQGTSINVTSGNRGVKLDTLIISNPCGKDDTIRLITMPNGTTYTFSDGDLDN